MKTKDNRYGWSRSALIMILSLVPVILPSQSIWMDRADGRNVSIEMLKPNPKHVEANSTNYAFFYHFRLPVADSDRLVFELPLAYTAYQDYHYDDLTDRETSVDKSETAIGNPYLGVETSDNTAVSWEMGLRLPLSPEDKSNARVTGMFTDFDRAEAFGHDLLPLQVSLNFRQRDASGFLMRLRGGPDLWILTGSEAEGDKTEFWMHYSVQFGYEGEWLNLLAGGDGQDVAFRKRSPFQGSVLQSTWNQRRRQPGTPEAGSFRQISAGQESFRIAEERDRRQTVPSGSIKAVEADSPDP